MEDPSMSAPWKAECAVVDLHRFIQIPFGDLQWFSSISFLLCRFPLKSCQEAVPVYTCPGSRGSVASLGQPKVPWDPTVALAPWVPSAEGHTCFGFASWCSQTVSTESPPHTLFCVITELLGLSCCHESAPIFVQWSQVGCFRVAPPFGCFSLLWQCYIHSVIISWHPLIEIACDVLKSLYFIIRFLSFSGFSSI